MSENFLLIPCPSVCIPKMQSSAMNAISSAYLNQILSFIFANEPNEQFLHVPSPSSFNVTDQCERMLATSARVRPAAPAAVNRAHRTV